MFKIMASLLLIGLICSPVFTQQGKYDDLNIDKILTMPEEDIDLGIACLVLAKDAYPNLNIQRFDNILNFMALRINLLMQGNTVPEARIGMMNTFLYRSGPWNDSLTFTYDLDDLEANQKNNQYLNGYLATRKGSCITMPMLHLVLADRLGWPMQAVRSPKHFFIRYVDANLPDGNVEATCGGGYVATERYITDTNIPEQAIKNGVYLRTLSKKEYIASLLINNARHYHEREQNLEKAMNYTAMAISIDSTFSSGYWNMGHYYYFYAQKLEIEMLSELEIANMMFTKPTQPWEQNIPNPSPYSNTNSLREAMKLPEPPKPSLFPPGYKPSSTLADLPHHNTPHSAKFNATGAATKGHSKRQRRDF